MHNFMGHHNAALLLLMGFFAITFWQSAFDKVIDRKGNLDFLNSHFKNSPLGGQVALMLSFLTLVEFTSAALCTLAIVTFFVATGYLYFELALVVCGVNLLMLLVGQRLAKDYAGASTLGVYMILVMAGFLLLG